MHISFLTFTILSNFLPQFHQPSTGHLNVNLSLFMLYKSILFNLESLSAMLQEFIKDRDDRKGLRGGTWITNSASMEATIS